MIDALIERMKELLEPMQAAGDPKRIFHATYLRPTIAVADEIQPTGGFADPRPGAPELAITRPGSANSRNSAPPR
jgi:Family of unknown function (DUF5995)